MEKYFSALDQLEQLRAENAALIIERDLNIRQANAYMDENKRLKTTLCKYQHIASPKDRKVTKLLTEIERLKAELAEAKKDAERLENRVGLWQII